MNFLVRKIHKYLSFFILSSTYCCGLSPASTLLLIKSNWSEENNTSNKTEESYDLSIVNFKIEKASDSRFSKKA